MKKKEKLQKVPYSGLLSTMAMYGHNQADLARLLGVKPSAISNLLHNHRKWNIEYINTICDYYQKPYEELFK